VPTSCDSDACITAATHVDRTKHHRRRLALCQ
jgi:hypothetical protein